MGSLLSSQTEPDENDVSIAIGALPHIKDYLARHPEVGTVRLVVDGEDGETLVVPRGAVELLARILAHMAAGHGVSVVPSHAELTTQQAADILNVSRPFLIGLLDAGEIEYRRVGAHRRIKAASLLDYMRRDDKRRRDAADELSALTRDLGLD
ncbi:MAG TPA: helix-turn-helix domain-containing protein [Mycobacteriales bacterium]|jgi:DNA binding domain, excisionase family